MSETASSPSVHLHPMSPSSSMSSTDSAPRSEPTSDEQPDLGAFTMVLREWTHLQPPPRIPVQIRSATSSTTPTFQPESILGHSSDFPAPSARSDRRLSGVSTMSSFTRPPSSSIRPDGSTVWAQAPIASYLFSQTPSNDIEEEGGYTPYSAVSSALTVEIASERDFPSFDEESSHLDFSPPSAVPVELASDTLRIDSRVTGHDDDEVEIVSTKDESSHTSRDIRVRTLTASTSQDDMTSIQLQSQPRPITTTATSSSSSLPLLTVSSGAGVGQLQSQARPTTGSSSSSLPVPTGLPPPVPSTSSHSQPSSTTDPQPNLIPRSRNPIPPRTMSDSSYTTSGSAASSNLSLLSYQIPETPPEESEHERSTTSSLRPQVASSASLVTQRVPPSSSTSTSTYAAQGQRPFHTSTASISSTGSPLPNPHSPLPTPSEVVAVEPHRPSLGMGLDHIVRDLSGVTNDMGTPDQPPSETLLFDPPRTRRNEFEPIDDEEDEDVPTATGRAHGFGFGYTDHSLDQGSGYISGYDHHGESGRNPRAYEPQHEDSDEDYPSRHPYSHNQTPHHAFSHTPRGVPPAEPQTFKLIPTTTSSFASQSTGQALQQPYAASSQTFSSPQPQHPLISNLIYQQQQQQQQQSQVPVQPQSLPVPPQSQPRASAQTHVVSQLQSSSTSTLTSAITSAFADKTATSTQPSTHSITSYPSPYTASSNLPIILESSHGHGYPRSLAGLHSLPTNLISPRSDTFSSSTSGSGTATAAGTGARTSLVSNFKDYPYVEPDSKTGTRSRAATIEDVENELPEMRFGAHLSEVAEEPHELPSLGYLDEALSFIAAERARWTAARESLSGQGGPGGSNGEGGEGGEADGDVGQMDEDWRHNLDFEQEHPKRKRRRKRPPRSHGPTSISIVGALEISAPPPSGDVPTTVDSTQQLATPHSSPKKKKRTKTGAVASSASASVHSLHLDSKDGAKTPSRGRSKGKEKEFLIAPTAAGSSVTGGVEKERSPVTILKRPVGSLLTNPVLSDDDGDSDDVGDGGRTPTNRLVGTLPLAGGMTDGSSASPINLTGKKGKRVGRKEREREKMRFDAAKKLAATGSINETEGVFGEDTEFGVQYIDDDDDDDDDEDEEDDDDDEDDSFQQPEDDENDSISNMSLLKPPRKRRERSRRRKASKDTSHIHSLAGITGAAYKSTPATPRASTFADSVNENEESPSVEAGQEAQLPPANVQEEDVFASKPNEATGSEKERRKRSRPKRSKSLVHAKSEPQLKLDAETSPTEVAAADEVSLHGSTKSKKSKKPDSGQGEDILEMDRSQLQQYLSASYNSQSGLLTNLRQTQNTQSQFPSESRRGRLLSLGRQLKQLFPEQREELGRVISRIERQGATQEGQGTKAQKAVGSDGVASGSHEAPVAPKSTPVSIPGVKRKRSRRSHARTASEGANIDGFELDDDGPGDGHSGLNLDANKEDEEIDPRGRPPKKGDVLVHVFIDHSNILIGLLSHIKRNMYRKGLKVPNRGKPLPALLTRATTANPASAFAAVKSTSTRPLPVPTGNGKSLNESPSKRSQPVPVLQPGSHPIPLPSFATVSRSLPTGSVLSKYMAGKNNGQPSDQEKDATSDGYEYPETDDAEEDKFGDDSLFIEAWKVKKKAPKHLWHAALAFILERGRPITRRVVVTSSPLYQPMESIERLGYELRVFIRVPDYGDGMDRERHKDKGAFKTNGGAKPTSPVNAVPFAGQKSAKGHTRRISGSTSAESGSGPGSGNASGGTSLHPYSGITNSITPQTKVKYREQGVDELLQLKLHQALAATDEVVEGSTIVLATGDGNMGQFNEDGFLGPVRTALRRGWKVELYAWEDGLSRAWKREFGDGSEWGRKGMFRVIAMEQFATWLVESVDWA